jgi:NADPH:quinone reductase-like Zn-dependent oxidoreductase
MHKTMRASVLTGPQTIELQERPVPQPVADEVLVRSRLGRRVRVGRALQNTGGWVHGGGRAAGARREVGGTIVGVGGAVDPARVGERVALSRSGPVAAAGSARPGT